MDYSKTTFKSLTELGVNTNQTSTAQDFAGLRPSGGLQVSQVRHNLCNYQGNYHKFCTYLHFLLVLFVLIYNNVF